MKKESSHTTLQGVDMLSYKDAYRNLPRTGEITVKVSAAGLPVALDLLEQAGFAGMRVDPSGPGFREVSVKALKGKQGKCFDTGRTALYTGGALAAMDDDHHLLFSGEPEPVCEKTATLYALSTYRPLVNCSEADPVLLERLSHDPQLFDCDTFESSVEKIHRHLKEEKAHETSVPLYYPGPFRLLVTKEGTLIRRGRINLLLSGEASRLRQSDGLFPVKEGNDAVYESFLESYRQNGSRCLLSGQGGSVVRSERPSPELSLLRSTPSSLKKRLVEAIKQGREYVILTGSNREDEYGCCPSDEVTWADRLTGVGVLCSYREDAPPDACPVTIYAFGNEISGNGNELIFNRDEAFRQMLLQKLQIRTGERAGKVARWALLLFVAVSIVWAVARQPASTSPSFEKELYQWLGGREKNTTALVLFHFSRRCTECLAMEEYTKEVLEERFSGPLERGDLIFRMAIIDLPENRDVMERLGVASISMGLMTFRDGQEQGFVRLEQAGMLYENETAFKDMVTESLEKALKMQDE